MHPKEAGAMANSVDPDQTASSEAVLSWSALFAEIYLSQYIEFLRYLYVPTSAFPLPLQRAITSSSIVLIKLSPFLMLPFFNKIKIFKL